MDQDEIKHHPRPTVLRGEMHNIDARYNFEDRFPWLVRENEKDIDNALSNHVHTTPKLIELLEKDKDTDIDARVLSVKGTEIRYRRLGREGFMEACKTERFREASDAFGMDLDISAVDNFVVGTSDFVPLLGGPFYKQMYYYDYIRQHGYAFYSYHHDPVARNIVHMMRDFTLGREWRVDAIADDESTEKKAQAYWDAFCEVNDLKTMMDYVAIELTIYGEEMIWWLPDKQTKIGFDLRPGQEVPKGLLPRIRLVDPSSIWEIVTYPEDITRVLYYQWVAPCLAGDTKISCLDGREVPIEQLAREWEQTKEPIGVYSFDLERRRVVPGMAHTVVATGKKRCVKVTLDNNESITCSYDHPFLMRDGRYVWAEDLRPQDSLMPLYRDSTKAGYQRVYQPEERATQTVHRMVAEYYGSVPNGFVVHHKDHNKKNNDPKNLEIVSRKEHSSGHTRDLWRDASYVAKVTEARNEAMRSDEYRQNMSKLKMGFVLSPESQEKRVKSWKESIKQSERFQSMAEENRNKFRARWALHRNNHKVVSVEDAGDHLVYDLTVEGTHNFALSAGVFTHNTQYQTYTSGQVPSSKFIFQQIPASQMMHYKVNSVSNEKRGRSDLFPVLGYLKRLRDSVNYSIIALQKSAAWAIDTSIEGSQADLDAYVEDQRSLGTIPTAGSEFVHTSKIVRQYLANQGRSAYNSDAFSWVLSMISMGTGIPVSYFGTHLSNTGTRAAAIVATEPVSKKFETRQNVYQRILKDIAARLFKQFGIDATIEVTFPEIVVQDRSAKLKDLQLAQAAGWISKERAANIAAKELGIDEFNYEAEKGDVDVAPGMGDPLNAPPQDDSEVTQDSPSAITGDEKRRLAMTYGA